MITTKDTANHPLIEQMYGCFLCKRGIVNNEKHYYVGKLTPAGPAPNRFVYMHKECFLEKSGPAWEIE